MNTPRVARRVVPRFGLLLALLLAAPLRAGPVAGTAITNTATGTYVDSTSGLNVRLTSNTVSTVVQPQEALQLTSSQTVTRAPGGSFTLAHVLTNTGNVTTTYLFNVSVIGGSFTPTGVQLVEDTNGNGIVDAGEPVIAQGGSLTLTSHTVLNLLVTATVVAFWKA